jgi:hypothetical protein
MSVLLNNIEYENHNSNCHFFISFDANCQDTIQKKATKLSALIEAHSYWWRLDSLASNGYRLCSSKDFFKENIIIDQVSKDSLVSQFGKPSSIWDTPGDQIIYRYYVYAFKTVPADQKEKFHFNAAMTLDFFFNQKTMIIDKVDQGTVDY